jgi:hypothetical protein
MLQQNTVQTISAVENFNIRPHPQLLSSASAGAQQINGIPGSPSATTTIDGWQLPSPDPKFGGVIKDDALQSKPWWAPRVVPPKSAPNVLLIITDDAGFGVPSTFGGAMPFVDFWESAVATVDGGTPLTIRFNARA